MDAETLSIRLTPEMAQLVRNEVARGAYASDSDVIQDALKLWHERAERLEGIKASLQAAADDPAPITAGEVKEHFERRFADLQSKRGDTRSRLQPSGES